MIYNTAELDSMEPVDSYQKEPTWVDTFQAATKNFTSVSLSTSERSYFTEERNTNMEEWKTKDPENKSTYDAYGTMPKSSLDKLEVLYDEGNVDAIKGFNQTMPGHMSTGETFLKFKELQGLHGFKGYAEFNQDAKDKSLKDFQESQEVLSRSDSLSAELLGTMYGALHDPATLATLPVGGWMAGRGVMVNAARAFGQEAMIETGAQAVIAPTVHSYKNEIGLKTSIATEAYNAAMAIGTAGLVRGVGSAAFDLSAKGIKALKVKDPELGMEYENLAKTQPTQDMKTHMDNMNKVEFSGELLSEIKTPNEKGLELNNAKVISEVDEDIIRPLPIKEEVEMENVESSISKLTDDVVYKIKPEAKKFEGEITLLKNTEKAPDLGKRFAQDVEPSGFYAIQKETKHLDKLPNYETVYANIKKPIIVDVSEDLVQWKRDMSKAFQAKGERLTEKLKNKGFDSIITTDKDGDLGEIIILDTSIISSKKAKKVETKIPEVKPEDDLQIVVDKDIEGNIKTRSYKEINQELDDNDIMFKRIQDCILGVK